MSDAHDRPRHDMLIEGGKPAAMAPADVRRTMERMIDEGDILAVIVRIPSGNIAVQVFGPPSMELVEQLEQVVHDFRTVVEEAQ